MSPEPKRILKNLKKYLNLTFGVNVQIRPWKNRDKLPFFLLDIFEFYTISLLSHSCVFMIAKEEEEMTPGLIEKYRQTIKKEWPGVYIYVGQNVTPYNRSRLIQNQTSFIIPGNQMYLPELGMDLHEHFRKPKINKKFFSPAAQLVIIYVLVDGKVNKLTPSALSIPTGYSIMSVNRVFDELQAARIGEMQKIGRELYWTFESKKALWEKAKIMMRSPVKKRIWLKTTSSLKNLKYLAGLSALSYYSMLNPPLLPVFALSYNSFKRLKAINEEILSTYEGAGAELEIWQYDPTILQQDSIADPFSVYLSLKDNTDERLQSALEEMMEKIKW